MAIGNKIYLAISGFILSFFLIISFIVLPLLEQIKNNSQELTAEKEKLVDLEAKIVNLQKFKNLGNELSSFLEEINNLFVDAKAPIAFIDFLEKTARKSRLTIEIMPPILVEKTEEDLWSYFKFHLILTGSFIDFLKFLEKIENSPYLVEVQSITFSSQAMANYDKVMVDLIIKVFVK
ncbi:MAG: type 4a pilus biogenesis protein PilO [Minisyncoccales bacterium]